MGRKRKNRGRLNLTGAVSVLCLALSSDLTKRISPLWRKILSGVCTSFSIQRLQDLPRDRTTWVQWKEKHSRNGSRGDLHIHIHLYNHFRYLKYLHIKKYGENRWKWVFYYWICVKLNENSRKVKQCLKVKNSLDGCGRRLAI